MTEEECQMLEGLLEKLKEEIPNAKSSLNKAIDEIAEYTTDILYEMENE